MLKDALLEKRCLMVCGGGGVGKTTVAASIAIAAARVRPRVLVVTIDPAKRLLQAFGFTDALHQEGGAPLPLSAEVLKDLGLPEETRLSVAVLNPRWVLEQIVTQSLPPAQASRLRDSVLYREMGQMIHGLSEYTAYEWVTRLLAQDEYDLIVLDTPPAFHAKEFFNAPEKIKNLMESRVFQLFLPSKSSWMPSWISLGWIEKILGERVTRESRLFFETFASVRERILSRCGKLAEFFSQREVAVVVVGTPDSTPMLELEGLVRFLEQKRIPIEAIVMNQVEPRSGIVPSEWIGQISPELLHKLGELESAQDAKADRAQESLARVRHLYPGREVVEFSRVLQDEGFGILCENARRLMRT